MSAMDAFDASDNDRFVVHLSRRGDGEVMVTSIDLQHSDIRNRYTFKQGRNLHEVFTPGLAQAMNSALANLVKGERIVSLPDFSVALPGVVLGGLRILRTKTEDGVDLIMLRVREFVGSIKSAFRFDQTMAVDSISMRERIAVEVLRDIVNPLLDIMSIANDSPGDVLDNNADAVRRQLRRMSNRQDEVNFYTGLLKRYVAGCRSDVLKGPPNSRFDLDATPAIGRN